jgi:MFS family permease
VIRQGYLIASVGTAQTLAWGSTYYLPAILANHMAADLGITTATVFAAFSAALLLSAVLAPASGGLIDRFGGRLVLGSSNVVFAAGLAMLGASSGLVSLVASWLVIGIGMSAGLYESAFASLARIYGLHARRPITGITLVAGFASTVCWPLSAWMDASIGWRATCLVWAAAHLLIALPLNLLLPQTRSIEAEPVASSEPPARGRLAFMVALSFVFTSTWFCSTAMAAHLPRLLQEAGATLAVAITAAALVGPAQVAARMLEYWLMRRFHPVYSARIAALAHPIGAAGLATVGAPAATFFAVAHGAGNGVMTIANGTLPLHYFGAAGYGQRQGWMMAPARVLQAGAPFAFDFLLARHGVGALAVTAALSVASFLVLAALPAQRSPSRTL